MGRSYVAHGTPMGLGLASWRQGSRPVRPTDGLGIVTAALPGIEAAMRAHALTPPTMGERRDGHGDGPAPCLAVEQEADALLRKHGYELASEPGVRCHTEAGLRRKGRREVELAAAGQVAARCDVLPALVEAGAADLAFGMGVRPGDVEAYVGRIAGAGFMELSGRLGVQATVVARRVYRAQDAARSSWLTAYPGK